MGYVQSITGDPINPNPFSYSVLSLTGSVTLEWPDIDANSVYPATDWIDVTADAGFYVITLPDSQQVGIGREIVFNNDGANFFYVNDAAGNSLGEVDAGTTKRFWVVTNPNPAGTWGVVSIGSGTSGADAGVLAGYGLTALANKLSQSMPTITYSSSTTLLVGVRAFLVIWTGGSGTLTMPTASVAGDDWFCFIKNSGSGTLTIASAQNIDKVSSVAAGLEIGFIVGCDGATYYTVGRASATASPLSQLNKSVAGAVDVTLTSSEAAYNIINLTGAITANINIIVPATLMEWIVFNNTTGAFTLTVKTPLGTGITISQTTRNLLYCDGTNVQRQDAVNSGTVTSITAGTGLTGGTITSAGTIGLNVTAVTAGTYGAVNEFLQIVVNAQGQLTAASTGGTGLLASSNLSDVANIVTALANLFGATPVIPSGATGTTQAAGNSTTKLATTAFVNSTALTLAAGSTGATQAANDSTTKVATTAFVNPANSLAASGYQELASGLILQWGITASITSATNVSVSFPLAFSGACYIVITQPTNTLSNGPGVVSSKSATQFNLGNNANATQAFYYFAVGK